MGISKKYKKFDRNINKRNLEKLTEDDWFENFLFITMKSNLLKKYLLMVKLLFCQKKQNHFIIYFKNIKDQEKI